MTPSTSSKNINEIYRYGLTLSELISEGNIEIIQSLNRFDPKRDLDFRHTQCGG